MAEVSKQKPKLTVEPNPYPQDRKATNLVGKILNTLHRKKWLIHEKVLSKLLERNGVDSNLVEAQGYKIEKETTLTTEGERTTYRLYKLLDQTQVHIKVNVGAEVHDGNGSNN